MRTASAFCLCAALMLAAIVPAAAAPVIGIVLLHGRTGTPNQFAKLAAALTGAGYAVAAPEMCWSKKRIFDEDFTACLTDVDAAVAKLEASGVKKIVVAGMSQGAIAALAYGASHPDLAGIVAMGPAGDPADLTRAPTLATSVKLAGTLVKAGKGNTVADFNDVVTGDVPVPVAATPEAFLSFHGPDSPIATMKRVIAKLLPQIKLPVLWIAGTHDPSQASAAQGFAKIPKNKLNRLATVDADHGGTPDASAEALTGWLATLQ